MPMIEEPPKIRRSIGWELYPKLLGSTQWEQIPHSLRVMHTTVRRAHGKAKITRGTSILAKAIVAIFSLPKEGEDVHVSVIFERTEAYERWHRIFGGTEFRSDQYAGRGRFDQLLCEKFGPFTFGIALTKEGKKIRLEIKGWEFLGIKLPQRLLPSGDFYEEEKDNRFNFNVAIEAPVVGKIIHYQGYLEPLEHEIDESSKRSGNDAYSIY